MKTMMIILFFSGLVFAETSSKKIGNVVEESYMDPTVEEAKMPGTRKSIEEVNTSPNPVPQAEEYKYNDVLIDGKYIDDLNKEKQEKEEFEDDSEE